MATCMELTDDDKITSTHRGHGHCIAKGADVGRMFAEFFGKETGYCHGRGGSMHIADVKTGNLGANGIDADPAPVQMFAQSIKIGLQAFDSIFVFGLDDVFFDHDAHRVKAWTLPASTFRILPVDLADRSDDRKYAASAISSGRTDRFSIDRWRYISSSPSLSVL